MKVAFVGPSAPDARKQFQSDILEIRGPAARGDVAEAVLDGATVIGLVDGTFEANAAVWHKEILYALSHGLRVFGAASMGALRAAECAPYGMVGVGKIFEDLAAGRIIDDDAVAVVHAPEDFGHVPLSEALVNVVATVRDLREMERISESEALALMTAARTTFFKDRTYDRIVDRLEDQNPWRRVRLRELLSLHRFDQKQDDALELLRCLVPAPDQRASPPRDWQFNETLAFRAMLNEVEQRRGARLVGQQTRSP